MFFVKKTNKVIQHSNSFGKHDVRVNAERQFLAEAVLVLDVPDILDYLTALRDEFNGHHNGSGVVVQEINLVGLVVCCDSEEFLQIKTLVSLFY